MLDDLFLGFAVSFQPQNLLSCIFGVFLGQIVGVLPGIGPVGAMSILLPITFYLNPVSAIILFSGVYYGAQYGGSITSILLNIPGEATTVMTCLDGYQMARKGRGGPALGISAFGSFIAGTLSVFGLILLCKILAQFALSLSTPEYFTMIIFGIVLTASIGSGSKLKSLISVFLGLWVGAIGMDITTSTPRFTFGSTTLFDGVGLVPVAMGLFGVSEVLINIEHSLERDVFKERIGSLLPNLQDWFASIGPILRGTVLGFFLGILPGGGAIMASFFSYGIEKKISRHPEKFGTGIIEGVAAPESANNAAAQGAFIPLLTLGIPSNIVMAMVLGAFLIHGVTPGPLLISKRPDLFWGVITSMYMGNIMLLIFNIPMIGIWVKILKVPYYILYPLILLFCVVGVYTVNNNEVEIYILLFFGLVGYVFRKLKFDLATFIIALVLGPMLEDRFRQSLVLSGGKFSTFFTSPLSLLFWSAVIILLFSGFVPVIRRRKVIKKNP